MKIDRALRDLRSILEMEPVKGELSYKLTYHPRAPTVYATSMNAELGRSEINNVALFLQSFADHTVETKAKAAIFTCFLLAHLVSFARPNVIFLSKESTAAGTLHNNTRFTSMFDEFHDGRFTNMKNICKFQSMVAIINNSGDVEYLSDLFPVEKGVIIHPAELRMDDLFTVRSIEPEEIALGVDLGDGSASAHVWGHR